MPVRNWFRNSILKKPDNDNAAAATAALRVAKSSFGLHLVSETREPWNDKNQNSSSDNNHHNNDHNHHRTCLYDHDIIFVHGLNGHFDVTWTHKETKYFWPRDRLLTEFPGIRVYCYAYDAAVSRLSRSKATIADFALIFLNDIHQERKDKKSQSRPIIFIVHSLGGILVKEALAKADHHRLYASIWSCTKGIIFFGTPHRGSKVAALARPLVASGNLFIAPIGVGSARTDWLDLLETNSALLNSIHNDFLKHYPRARVVTYYETKSVAGFNSVIVDPTSAQIGHPDEIQYPMHADHREICRFTGTSDLRLGSVIEELKEMMVQTGESGATRPESQISLTASLQAAVRDCFQLLNTVDFSKYSDPLKQHIEGTLKWFQNHPRFLQWKTAVDSKILWISGYAGSGKTTLTLYTRQCLLQERNKEWVVVRFHCSQADEQQREGTHILQSIIYQIVEQCAFLWRCVTRAHNRHGPSHFQRLDGLWQILEQIVQTEKRPRIMILLDALDECNLGTQRYILYNLDILISKSKASELKVFITSRHHARHDTYHMKESHFTEIRLDDHRSEIAQDVSLVIQTRLQTLVDAGRCQANIQDLMARELITHADKNFLWVKLAFSILEKRQVLLKTSLQEIASLGKDTLEDLYCKHLSMLEKHETDNIVVLLGYIVASDRPLKLVELALLFTMEISGDDASFEQLEEPLLNGLQITNLLGILVSVENDYVQLVHYTLKEFLVSLKPEHPLFSRFGISIQDVKSSLARHCVHYIERCLRVRRDLESSASSPSEDNKTTDVDVQVSAEDNLTLGLDLFEELSTETIALRTWSYYTTTFQLFDYAALHWQTDLPVGCESGKADRSKLWELALELYLVDNDLTYGWFRYTWAIQMPSEAFPHSVDALMKAAYFGHHPIIRELLLGSDIAGSSVQQAMYWAIRRDNATCLEILSDWDTRAGTTIKENFYPMCIAAEFGSLKSLVYLLRTRSNLLNVSNDKSRTPLMIAAAQGQSDIVGALLKVQDIYLSAVDKDCNTVMHWAVYSESLKTLKELLKDVRSPVDLPNRNGRTPFMEAAENGNFDMVTTFLEHRNISINHKDSQGRTAFSLSCGNGHLSIVKYLSKRRDVVMLDKDIHGRVPHSWASSQKETRILTLLIKKAPQALDIPDDDGWTPFAWTLGPPAIQKNAVALLETGQIDVNRRDSFHGRSLLGWLANYGESALMQLLFSYDNLDIEAKDNYGRTPLMEAANAGHVDAIKLLLTRNRQNINAQDDHGRTAIAWAAREGRMDALMILSGVHGVDMSLKDNEGCTPLDAARNHDHHEVAARIQTLLDQKSHHS